VQIINTIIPKPLNLINCVCLLLRCFRHGHIITVDVTEIITWKPLNDILTRGKALCITIMAINIAASKEYGRHILMQMLNNTIMPFFGVLVLDLSLKERYL